MADEKRDVGLEAVHEQNAEAGRTELEGQPSIGVLALIVGLDPERNGDNASDPLIWVITELQGKPETQKRAGQISAPAETKTLWENRRSNVLGVLAEFTNDATLAVTTSHLYEVESTYRDGRIAIGQSNVADLAVFVYDGPLSIPFQPVCRQEVSPIGWVKVSQLRQFDGLRDVLRQALDLDQREGIIRQTLEDFYAGRGKKRVIPAQLASIEEFIAGRETSPDVPILSLPKPVST
jgi:hypothetical protein